MVAGHLQQKKNLYYIVLDYQDTTGRRRQKWLPTGLPVKGNKKKAEAMTELFKRISESLSE